MPKDIDVAEMQKLIEKVRLNILTSNDVVSIIDHPLPFFGVRDKEYKVDAVTEIKTKQDRITALSLQDTTQRYGRFFQNKDGQRMFVLEGINLRGEQPNIWDHVNARLS